MYFYEKKRETKSTIDGTSKGNRYYYSPLTLLDQCLSLCSWRWSLFCRKAITWIFPAPTNSAGQSWDLLSLWDIQRPTKQRHPKSWIKANFLLNSANNPSVCEFSCGNGNWVGTEALNEWLCYQILDGPRSCWGTYLTAAGLQNQTQLSWGEGVCLLADWQRSPLLYEPW